MLVDFLLAGARDAGTAKLAHLLGTHPEIRWPYARETRFFDTDAYFTRRDPPLEAYHASFPRSTVRATGDATPSYFYWEPAPSRIGRYNPAAKWILVLGDPVERAHAQFLWERSRGAETLSFSEAIRAEPARLAATATGQHHGYGYADRSRYAAQLRRVLEEFPRSQLLALRAEDLDLPRTLADVQEFLGVPPIDLAPAWPAEAAPHSIAAEDRRFLDERLEDDLLDLESLLGWDCSSWRDVTPVPLQA